jgi:hypothetical protein
MPDTTTLVTKAAAMLGDASLTEQELGWRAVLGIAAMVASAWYWQQQLQLTIGDIKFEFTFIKTAVT